MPAEAGTKAPHESVLDQRTRAAVVRLLSAKPKRKTVLLCGPMHGGTTTLWHALQRHRLPLGTVTSMQENDVICAPIPVRALAHPSLHSRSS